MPDDRTHPFTLSLIAHLAHGELFATIVESKPEAMDSIGREVRDTVVLSIRGRHSLAGNHCSLLVTIGILLDAARHLCACVQFVLDDQHHVVVFAGSLDWAR